MANANGSLRRSRSTRARARKARNANYKARRELREQKLEEAVLRTIEMRYHRRMVQWARVDDSYDEYIAVIEKAEQAGIDCYPY